MRAFHAYLFAGLLAAYPAASAHAQTITDELYNSHHPRLLITPAELPALQQKLTDGGVDDALYAGVRQTVTTSYPSMSPAAILGAWYGDQSIPCIGLVAQLENDASARALGRVLTTYIADNYEPDTDEANSGMRLRALAIGYDMCFGDASEAERGHVRDEIVRYIQKMVWTQGYQAFQYQPYLGNHSAMFGAALGLAAIALQGEADAPLLDNALAMVDRIVDNLLTYQFDPGGSYNEGAFYAAWTLKQLVYYFDARHRYDGRTYTDNARLRAVEQWLAYEIEPEGQGRSFNLNDSPEVAAPLALNPTYFNWAMSGWNSGLSSWLWLHTAGSLGTNFGAGSDWTGTILWNRPVPVVEPGSVLPASRVWEHRGLYYYRSGWPSGASSNDFVFSFFSGKFEGGHAQEDQNQFALTAYGSAFAVDHGSGNAAKESEAHNMVFIDGQGQHNAGASIGTDGRITGYLLGAFADVVAGDATAAYTTYSPFNAHDVPFPGTDWSWGYSGANPVRFALRTVTVVHGAGLPAYALVMDDIDKDGALHTYDWRLHTDSGNVVDTGANPISVTGTGAHMELHLIDPDFSAVAVTTAPFNVGNGDPASTLIRVSRAAVNPKFTFLMLPLANGTSPPSISRQSQSWGCGATINWPGSKSDIIVRNDSGSAVTYSGVTTDGAVAVVRKHGSVVDAYMMEKGSTLAISGTTYATLSNGPASCEWSDGTVELDRYDADFRILDKGVNVVLYRDQQLGFVVDNGYVVPGGTTAVGPSPAASDLQVHAHPNPFNPETTIEIDGVNHRRVTVVVYDVAGRRVRTLWTGVMDAARALSWNGRDDRGAGVASGSYFVRVESSGRSQTVKITLLK